MVFRQSDKTAPSASRNTTVKVALTQQPVNVVSDIQSSPVATTAP